MKVALTVNSKSTKDTEFYHEFATNVHMTYDCLLFSTYSEVQLSRIRMADNSNQRVMGKGTVSFKVIIDGGALQVNFLNVLYSLDLEYNLLSVVTIKEAGYSVLAKNGKMTVFNNEDKSALVETQMGTGYLVDIPCDWTYQALSSHSPSQNRASWTEWHRPLGHLDMQDVKKLAGTSLGINAQKTTLMERAEPPDSLCEACVIGKHHRTPSEVIHRIDP